MDDSIEVGVNELAQVLRALILCYGYGRIINFKGRQMENKETCTTMRGKILKVQF